MRVVCMGYMAISAKVYKGTRYLRYNYHDGKKMISIYCGKEGEPRTDQKIREAKRKHYESKQERARKKLLEE